MRWRLWPIGAVQQGHSLVAVVHPRLVHLLTRAPLFDGPKSIDLVSELIEWACRI